MRRWLRGRGGNVAEEALLLPLVLLIVFGLIAFALAGVTSASASAAADHAARVAAVSQDDPVGRAVDAATHMLASAPGVYHVTVTADTTPGGTVTVRVEWEAPNPAAGFLRLMGMHHPVLHGAAVASRYKEGW